MSKYIKEVSTTSQVVEIDFEKLVEDGLARVLTENEGKGCVLESVTLDTTQLAGKILHCGPTILNRVAQSNVALESYQTDEGWGVGEVGLYLRNSQISFSGQSEQRPTFEFFGDRGIHCCGAENQIQNVSIIQNMTDWERHSAVTPAAISAEDSSLTLNG